MFRIFRKNCADKIVSIIEIFENTPIINNRKRSGVLLKDIDCFFEKGNRDTQERFRKHMLEICRKEKVSLEKAFCVLFLFYLMLVCLSQFITCCV